MASVLAWPPPDPWALPAGLEWCADPDNVIGWMVRSTTGAMIDFATAATVLPLLQRRNREDPPNASGRISGGPSAQSIPRARVTCPDCNGSRVYVGLGFFPAEMCRTCVGTGKVANPDAPIHVGGILGTFTMPPDWMTGADPWALPPEAVAAGLTWYHGPVSWGVQRMIPWADLFEHPDTHGYAGTFDDLDPSLVARLFESIKRRNVAGPLP